MLRLSKQADYAIVLLSKFARRGEGSLLSARDLSSDTTLPLPTVSKILKALSRADLLESQRGVKGGYSLKQPADRISVADIIQALEGPIAVTDCAPETSRGCEHETRCPVRAPLTRLNHVLKETLEKVTLQELVEPLVQIEL